MISIVSESSHSSQWENGGFSSPENGPGGLSPFKKREANYPFLWPNESLPIKRELSYHTIWRTGESLG